MMKKYLFVLLVSVLGSQISFAVSTSDSTVQKTEDRITFAGRAQGEISKEELMSDSLKIVDEYLFTRFRITYFRLTMESPDGKYLAFENNKDGKLSPEMKDAVKKATTGWKINFRNFSAADNESSGSIVIPAKLFFVLK